MDCRFRIYTHSAVYTCICMYVHACVCIGIISTLVFIIKNIFDLLDFNEFLTFLIYFIFLFFLVLFFSNKKNSSPRTMTEIAINA